MVYGRLISGYSKQVQNSFKNSKVRALKDVLWGERSHFSRRMTLYGFRL